jgi:hypothetical protein
MPRNIAPYAKPVATIHAEAKNIRKTPKLFGVVKMLIMKAPVEPRPWRGGEVQSKTERDHNSKPGCHPRYGLTQLMRLDVRIASRNRKSPIEGNVKSTGHRFAVVV